MNSVATVSSLSTVCHGVLLQESSIQLNEVIVTVLIGS